MEFNIQESARVRNFLGVYYEWVREEKCLYSKMNMEKHVDKLVGGYEKFIGGDVKVQKTLGAPGTTMSKSELEKPKDVGKYRSFVGQLMWYTMKVGPGVANAIRDLALHMSHTGP